MNSKLILIFEALFVVFLWSASKVLLKWGVEAIPPYFLIATVQFIALSVLGMLYLFSEKPKVRFSSKEISLMILGGIVAASANLFIVIGLEYVSAGMAGLLAATNAVFGMLLATVFLRERPKLWQYAGIAVVVAGVYTALFGNLLTGTFIGIALLVLAEVAFAYNNVVTRLVQVHHKESIGLFMSFVATLAGFIVLFPTALIVDGIPQAFLSFKAWLVMGTVGVIFAIGGMLWTGVLDKLRVLEVSILSNTMIIQVAALSVFFLGEKIVPPQLWGSVLVILGALMVNGTLLMPRRR